MVRLRNRCITQSFYQWQARVDEKKTKALRAKMAKQRGKVKMFDRGGDIAELKKRCKKETGLDAPRQPEFQAWALKFLEDQPKPKGRIKMARG